MFSDVLEYLKLFTHVNIFGWYCRIFSEGIPQPRHQWHRKVNPMILSNSPWIPLEFPWNLMKSIRIPLESSEKLWIWSLPHYFHLIAQLSHAVALITSPSKRSRRAWPTDRRSVGWWKIERSITNPYWGFSLGRCDGGYSMVFMGFHGISWEYTGPGICTLRYSNRSTEQPPLSSMILSSKPPFL